VTETIEETVQRVRANGIKQDSDEPYANVDLGGLYESPSKLSQVTKHSGLASALQCTHLDRLAANAMVMIQAEKQWNHTLNRLSQGLQRDVEDTLEEREAELVARLWLELQVANAQR